MRPFLLLLAVILVSTGCAEKKSDPLAMEKQVMAEVFPSLADSLYIEAVTLVSPRKVTEAAAETEDMTRARVKKGLATFKENGQAISLYFDEMVSPLNSDQRSFMNEDFRLIAGTHGIGYSLKDLELHPDKVFLVKYGKLEKAQQLTGLYLSGLSLSRILFNKTQDAGLLEATYTCGGLCGGGFRVFIKKVNGRWKTERIELRWIS